MRLLYSLFMYLATPFALVYFGVRSWRDPRYRQRLNERLGFGPPANHTGVVHVHAPSVGEVNAGSPLVRVLLDKQAAHGILVTTVTPTGAQRVRDLFGDRVEHRYLPLDLPGATRRFLGRHRPAMVIIIETEIWPNLFRSIARKKIPLLIANAKLSAKSQRGYRRFGGLIRQALSLVNRVLAQSAGDAQRYIDCGANPGRVEVAGNLKFDVALPDSLAENGRRLRTAWGPQRFVVVAGSTHADDEAALLQAFGQLLPGLPDALLVLVPRHPERFGEAASTARQAGLATHSRSSGEPPPDSTQCLVVDAMGELLGYYAAADVAFVGGTIAAIGGHNVLEPAALGRPILVGPHNGNVAETMQRLEEAGAALVVKDGDELLTALRKLSGDADQCERMGQAGRELVTNSRGALTRTWQVIEPLLGETAPPGI